MNALFGQILIGIFVKKLFKGTAVSHEQGQRQTMPKVKESLGWPSVYDGGWPIGRVCEYIRHITSAPCLSHWHWVTILLMWIYRVISCIYIAGRWIPLWLAEGHKKVGRQISGRGQGSSVTDVDAVEFVTRLVRVKLILLWLLKPRNYPFGTFSKIQARFVVLFSKKK